MIIRLLICLLVERGYAPPALEPTDAAFPSTVRLVLFWIAGDWRGHREGPGRIQIRRRCPLIRQDIRPRVRQSFVMVLRRLGMKQRVSRYDRPQATGRGQVIAQEERQVLRRRVMEQSGPSTGTHGDRCCRDAPRAPRFHRANGIVMTRSPRLAGATERHTASARLRPTQARRRKADRCKRDGGPETEPGQRGNGGQCPNIRRVLERAPSPTTAARGAGCGAAAN